MEIKLDPYFLSAEQALSLVAKSFNIKIDVNGKDIDEQFKDYDKNNIHDRVKMQNFFLSLGLSLKDIHFSQPEDLLNEPMPLLLLTQEWKWIVCVGGGQGLKLINSKGELCEINVSSEQLQNISAFSLQPLQNVVDGIRVTGILKQAFSVHRIFYTKYFFASFFMALFALTFPVFSNLYYDKLVPTASSASLFGILTIVFLFIIFEFILRSSKDIYQSITSRKDDVDIDISFLEAIIYNKKKNGRSMSSAFVLWNEFQKIKPVLLNTLFQRLGDIPIFFVFILVVYINLGWIVVIPLLTFCISILMAYFNYRYTYDLINKQKEKQKNRSVFMTEVFYSIEMIHTLNN